jgi:Tol biopolymer transport system component/DNA-binding winged helix-turn-helix (wHTH) protein
MNTKIVRFGEFVFDRAACRLLKGGVSVGLEPKALDLLDLLVERAPMVVDKAEIFALVWKGVAVTDNALTRVVAQLRRALDDDAKSPRYIETVATRGYRFVADVRVAEMAPPVQDFADARSRRFRVAAGTVVVLLVCALMSAGLAWAFLWSSRARSAPSPGQRSPFEALSANELASLTPVQVTTTAGLDTFPSVSPDGQTIAFSSDRNGALEIYVLSLTPGAIATQLTNDRRQNVQPDWSPDGEYIAYHAMNGEGVWIVPARGGVPRQAAPFGSHPAWSPDGRSLAFQSAPLTDLSPSIGTPGAVSTIWMVNTDRGEPVQLTRAVDPGGVHLGPLWSADGRRIFFIVGRAHTSPGQHAIWVVDIGSRRVTRVAAHPQITRDVTIAPDGSQLYFRARETGALWRLPIVAATGAASGEPEPTGLPVSGAGVRHFRFSRDGRRFTWASLELTSNIWAIDVDASTGAPRGDAVALTREAGARATSPTISRDGRVAFGLSSPGTSSDVWTVAGGGRAPVAAGPEDELALGWTPDGRSAVVSTSTPDGVRIAAVDPETGRQRLLAFWKPPLLPAETAAIGTPVLSPDLRRAAISLLTDDVPHLWTAELASGTPAFSGPITHDPQGGTYPAWSPDSRSLAYQCADGSSTQVCVVPAAGGPSTRLTNEPGESWVNSWSPDATRVVFAERRKGVWNIAWVSRTGGVGRRITSFTDPRVYVRYPVWSPQGDRIVFERGEITGRLWSMAIGRPQTP